MRANSNHQRAIYLSKLKTVGKLETFGSGGKKKMLLSELMMTLGKTLPPFFEARL